MTFSHMSQDRGRGRGRAMPDGTVPSSVRMGKGLQYMWMDDWTGIERMLGGVVVKYDRDCFVWSTCSVSFVIIVIVVVVDSFTNTTFRNAYNDPSALAATGIITTIGRKGRDVRGHTGDYIVASNQTLFVSLADRHEDFHCCSGVFHLRSSGSAIAEPHRV